MSEPASWEVALLSVADALRLVCAAEALVLVPGCIYCISARITLDQRARFAALALIGVVVVGGQIDGWGNPGSWRMPVLAAGLALAVAGVVGFLRRERRRAERE